MQSQNIAEQETKNNITIVATISKSGGRYVLGIPAKYEDSIRAFHGAPLRVKIEPLL